MASITRDEDLETPPTVDSLRTAAGASSIAVDFQLSSALRHIERRQYALALRELEAILADQPDHPEAAELYCQVGAAQRQQGELRASQARGRSARR